MQPKTYRKRPVEIEAVQINCLDHDQMCEIIGWINDNGGEASAVGGDEDTGNTVMRIDTLEGTMFADCGDFIIRGVAGEFYPCKPDIFMKTYEFVWG